MANSFQHGVWLALMVNTYEDHQEWAWEFGVAHEGHAYDLPTNDIDGQRSRMDIINNHVGHKLALVLLEDDQLTDERLCRRTFARVRDRGLYIAPPVDPKQEYFARDLAPAYEVPVWRKIKTHGTREVVESLNIDDCSLAAD
jgi:hypothetical protein